MKLLILTIFSTASLGTAEPCSREALDRLPPGKSIDCAQALQNEKSYGSILFRSHEEFTSYGSYSARDLCEVDYDRKRSNVSKIVDESSVPKTSDEIFGMCQKIFAIEKAATQSGRLGSRSLFENMKSKFRKKPPKTLNHFCARAAFMFAAKRGKVRDFKLSPAICASPNKGTGTETSVPSSD